LDSTHFLRYQDAYQASVAGDTIQVQAGAAISSVGGGAQGSRISGGNARAPTIEIDNPFIGAGELVQVSGGTGDPNNPLPETRLVDRAESTQGGLGVRLFFTQPLDNQHRFSDAQVTAQGILGIGKKLTIQGDVGAPAAIAANMHVLTGVTGVTFQN